MLASSAQFIPVASVLLRGAVRQRGAYALVHDSSGQRLLLMRAEGGRCYLPGGRIEPGENARAALLREIVEECGWSAAIEAPLGKAQHSIMGGAVELEASYWRARLVEPLGLAGEHQLMWVKPAEALNLLHREGDRKVVAEALSRAVPDAAA